MKLIDGTAISGIIREELRGKIEALAEKGIVPGLAVVLVGDDMASKTYVDSKEKACRSIGVYSEKHRLKEETTQEELLLLIEKLNFDPMIDGILVQLPLPGHIDEQAVIGAISPAKDVDGFHPENVGKLIVGQPGFVSCTPGGIMELLKRSGIDIAGKHAVVVGRSNIVGKPMAMMLLREHATVTICHSKTRGLKEVTRMGDILIVSVGKAGIITGDMVKEGAAVIDVGINRLENALVGDVDFEDVSKVAGWLTPVPGGVGPMTIAMLLANTVLSAERRKGKA